MKTFKKIASLGMALTIIATSMVFSIPANAAEVDDTASVSADASIQSNVQDGVILHAFNWSYNTIKENLPAIAAAGYSTVQTSPVQQPKDYTTSADVSGQWWKLYQPVSMQIAEKSWLGTKTELTALCSEADKYGIKIICDIVSNHMGNEVETDANSLSSQVKTYQPDFYNNKSSYFHSYTADAADGSIQGVVQGHVSKAPDLNTGNTNVQNAVISLLKSCIDCGVDGFRFDAAKHIETPDDGSYASSFWPNITSSAQSYYKQKTGKDLYMYGEILNTCGTGRSYSSYTKYINIIDNKTSDSVLANVTNKNASSAASSSYQTGQSASKLVLWAESHDTFMGDSGSAGYKNTADISDENIIKAWAMVAARKDATALYFARPGSALMGQAATDTSYKSTAVSEVNKFHNLFVGQSEYVGSSGSIAYVRRGTSGIVLVNTSGTSTSVNVSGTGMVNGTYTDTVSGNTFTVSNGTVSGNIGAAGVAVVYNGSVTPRNTCSVESGSFKGDTMTVTLGLDNATSGTYCLDNSTPVTYTGTTTIRIGSDYSYGETINLTLTATNGSTTETTTYHYQKTKDDGSGVYVFFNAAKRSSWTAPYNVYIYDEDTSSTTTYKNASWPGQAMQYDSASGYYYVEVPNTCIAADASGNVIDENSSFNLAKSSNTYVIISGSGKNQQYPGDGSTTKLALGGSSKIFALTTSKSFGNTTLKPASTVVAATDVTKGTAPVETTVKPTTAPVTTTEPTTAQPTTAQPTTAQPTTAPAKYYYGDINLDEAIDIKDITLLQKYLAHAYALNDLQLELADARNDGIVDIKDASTIQMYVAGMAQCGRTGEPYNGTVTTPTQQPTTQPITQPATQPITQEPTTVAPTTTTPVSLTGDYYLFGYIDGANYGCEEDYENLGEYHFVNGQVTATFSQTSYVAVKTADNSNWFMTDGYQGKVESVILENTTGLGVDADKLIVPAGTVTFTLVENGDGTLTLSYESDGEFTDDTTPTTPAPTTTPGSLTGDYYLFGYIDGANYGCEEDYENLGEYHFVNGQVTATFSQTSYVAVKTADNSNWFMTDGYQGKVESVILENTTGLGVDADKLIVPAGTVTFTLVENGDGTLTLSYESDGEFTDDTTPTPTTPAPTTTPGSLTGDYYLFGYIDGANYGCEEDYENLGEYHFVNGQVTATFSQTSYVAVKTADNSNWFMTDGYQGKVESVILENTTGLGVDADKLIVPAGTVTFTLVENGDGTLTLSYESDGEFTDDTTPTPTTPAPTTTPGSLTGDYYLFGYIDGANYGCEEDYENLGEYHFVNGQVTATFSQTSYVAVKTADNSNWFMTDGYQGKVESVILENTTGLGVDADKLIVPAGTVTFTLVENGDGTLTLSYESDGEFTDDTTPTPTTPTPTTPTPTTPTPTTPVDPDTYTITFTNNKNWSKVYCYFWSTDDTTLSTWPGEAMTYSTTNDYGEKIYTIEIPSTADHIIFNNNSGSQTVNINVTGSAKYYISGGSGKNLTVATWE